MIKKIPFLVLLIINLLSAGLCKAQSANFTASTTNVCSGTTDTFTEQSTGSPLSWNWTFSGGTPGKSTSQDPVITYNFPGTYNVKLVVTYASGADSITKTGYVKVIQTPQIDGNNSEAQCYPAVFTISASASAGYVTWYAATTGGLPLDTGNSFTTPFLSVYTSYWVDATYDGCTTPTREEVAAEVQMPTITATTPASECGPGALTLRAVVSDRAGTAAIYWYADSTGGDTLATGVSFNTGNISTTTTYYVEGYFYGCTSPSRTRVVATVNSSQPSITAIAPDSICGPGTATLGATANGATIFWYADSAGGTLIDSGASFITPFISASVIYYADAANGCGSTTSRTPIVATVDTVPVITGVTTGTECGPGSVTLGATANMGTINWYSDSIAGSSIDTGSLFNTPFISGTTTYYVTAIYEGCAAARIPVVAMLNDTLTTPILTTTDSIICSSDSTIIQTTGNYSSYLWNDGDTLSYTFAKAAGAYWVTVSDANGCSAVSGHQNISAYPVPSVSIVVHGDTLSSFNAISYQWYLNDTLVPGATSPVYIAPQSGNYTVEITDTNGCVETSSQVNIGSVGAAVQNISASPDLNIYPNPSSSGNWQMVVSDELIGGQAEIYDTEGRLIWRSEITNQRSQIRINTASGIYILRVTSNQLSITQRLMSLF